MKSLFVAALAIIWTSIAIADVAPITPIGELERSSVVTVQGTVDRITDEDEFVLKDDTGDVKIYVGPNWVPVDPGEQVTVRGFVDSGLFIEVYAREITRANGSVVRMDRRYE